MLKINTRLLKCFLTIIIGLNLILYGFGRAGIEKGQNQLPYILKGTASYCDRLEKAIFHFFCFEKIEETKEQSIKYPKKRQGIKNFLENNQRNRETGDLSTPGSRKMSGIYDSMDKNKINRNYRSQKSKRKNTYVYDYQIIKEKKGVREQRKLVNFNQEKVQNQDGLPTTILYSYKNALIPIYLLSRQNQHKYNYSIIGKKKFLGRKAFIISVDTKQGSEEGKKLADVWIDTKDFSIMKFNVFPGAIKGYDELLKINKNQLLNLKVEDKHIFGYLRNGIRYPTKTEITMSYQRDPKGVFKDSGIGKIRHGGVVFTKIKTFITYNRYNFFDVSVGQPVFKNLH